MAIFEIPDLQKTVPVMPKATGNTTVFEGSTSFTVNNTTDQGLSGRVSVQPQGGAKPEWFKLDQPDRDFPAKSTQSFTVKLSVPSNAPGKYMFNLLAVNVADPDNLFAKSPVVAFDIPDTKPPKPFPIWILIAAGVALLLVIAIVLAIVLWPKPTPTDALVPSVVGETADKAKTDITTAGFTVTVTDDNDSTAAPGTVTTETPAGDGKATAKNGAEIKLTVATGVLVPTIASGKSYDFAAGILTQAGLNPARVNVAPTGKEPDSILALDPAPGARVSRQSTVKVNTDPGVMVPDVRTLQANLATNALTELGLLPHIAEQPEAGTVGIVLNQNPLKPQMVAKGSAVELNVRAAPSVPLCVTNYCLIGKYQIVAAPAAVFSVKKFTPPPPVQFKQPVTVLKQF